MIPTTTCHVCGGRGYVTFTALPHKPDVECPMCAGYGHVAVRRWMTPSQIVFATLMAELEEKNGWFQVR